MNREGHWGGAVIGILKILIKLFLYDHKIPRPSWKLGFLVVALVLYYLEAVDTPDRDLVVAYRPLMGVVYALRAWLLYYLIPVLLGDWLGAVSNLEKRVLGLFTVTLNLLYLALMIRVFYWGAYNGYSHRQSPLHHNALHWTLGLLLIYHCRVDSQQPLGYVAMIVILPTFLGLVNHKLLDSYNSLTTRMAWTYPGGVWGVLGELLGYTLLMGQGQALLSKLWGLTVH